MLYLKLISDDKQSDNIKINSYNILRRKEFTGIIQSLSVVPDITIPVESFDEWMEPNSFHTLSIENENGEIKYSSTEYNYIESLNYGTDTANTYFANLTIR